MATVSGRPGLVVLSGKVHYHEMLDGDTVKLPKTLNEACKDAGTFLEIVFLRECCSNILILRRNKTQHSGNVVLRSLDGGSRQCPARIAFQS